MEKIKPINLSPSFLSKVLSKGYDFSVAEKLGMIEKDTRSMQAGKALHSLLATSFGAKDDDIAISPFDNYRTKEARDWRDKQPDRMIILSEKEAELYSSLVKRIRKHPEIVKLIAGTSMEAEKVITKEVNGFTVKGVLDLVFTKEDSVNVIDWKFCSSKVFDDFDRKALWQHYDLQAAVYDFLVDSTHIYFVAIENEAPYRIKVWHCDLSMLEGGADKFNKASRS